MWMHLDRIKRNIGLLLWVITPSEEDIYDGCAVFVDFIVSLVKRK